MAERATGSELFIVDNSDQDWKVLRYLRDWCQISEAIDVATGYLEIGSLLALEDEWQKVDRIRILMGDEVSLRTRKAFETGLARTRGRLDASLETEKEKNDFLTGVPAIVEAIRSGKISCRVYRRDKFHAKAYITHARLAVVGSSALVGSSNLTLPGLSENIELNVQITGRQVGALQEWYEAHWREAEDVTPEILRTFERHTRDYMPFEIYAKSLHEYFRGHAMTADEWELTDPKSGGSRMYKVLDQYQREGYQSLVKIARQHAGAFLCDGVGLGKTFVGLMLIERLIAQERKRVALFVTKSSRKPVWESAIKRYLPHLAGGDYSSLAIYSHTDLNRGGEFPERFERIKEMADAVVIDEAHHFRNPGSVGGTAQRPSRYRRLSELVDGPGGVKPVFLLTATPINNRLIDFQHMVELFSRRNDSYFSGLGIHSLRGHFIRMEKELDEAMGGGAPGALREISLADAEQVLSADTLFRALVVQRSRAYVKQSQLQQGAAPVLFPKRSDPQVVAYSIKKTYGRLLAMVDKAFQKEKPLFALAIYYPLAYYKGADETIDPILENRQKQVVGLIRTMFLKRFESSAHAFQHSCERLLQKLLAFVTRHSGSPAEKRRLERWKQQHDELIGYVHAHQAELWGDPDEVEVGEDIVPDEMLEDVEELSREEFRIDEILSETFLDLDQVAEFLNELKKFKPRNDDKLKALAKLLKSDPVLGKHKVLIFSEFADTGHYLLQQLNEAGIEGADKVDSSDKRDRGEVIRRFAPYYNGSSSVEIASESSPEIRVLVSTDVLSEGLNLQDATRLINYDIHWNPVRLMQRIGRVDRRMDPEVEKRLLADHPDQAPLRGRVVYYNFLPPQEIDDLLRLYGRVAHKTLRISKTFGIEGKKLLTPDDDYEALKEFNHAYEGQATPVEAMHLEYQQLLKDNPDLAALLQMLPGRVFSGKRHPTDGARAVFFCYQLPGPEAQKAADGEIPWTEEAGRCAWHLYDLANEKILDDATQIVDAIRSDPDTLRHCVMEKGTLSEIRVKIDRHIKNTYLRQVQAPVGVKPVLKAWMELS